VSLQEGGESLVSGAGSKKLPSFSRRKKKLGDGLFPGRGEGRQGGERRTLRRPPHALSTMTRVVSETQARRKASRLARAAPYRQPRTQGGACPIREGSKWQEKKNTKTNVFGVKGGCKPGGVQGASGFVARGLFFFVFRPRRPEEKGVPRGNQVLVAARQRETSAPTRETLHERDWPEGAKRKNISIYGRASCGYEKGQAGEEQLKPAETGGCRWNGPTCTQPKEGEHKFEERARARTALCTVP